MGNAIKICKQREFLHLKAYFKNEQYIFWAIGLKRGCVTFLSVMELTAVSKIPIQKQVPTLQKPLLQHKQFFYCYL